MSEISDITKDGIGEIVFPRAGVKREHKETEEGKYAVCPACGKLSANYNICELCAFVLPDEPSYYCPAEQSKKRRTTPLQDGDQMSTNKSVDKKNDQGLEYYVQGQQWAAPPTSFGRTHNEQFLDPLVFSPSGSSCSQIGRADLGYKKANTKRAKYSLQFKLDCIAHAETVNSNRKCADFFGVDESCVRAWRRQKDQLQRQSSKSSRHRCVPGPYQMPGQPLGALDQQTSTPSVSDGMMRAAQYEEGGPEKLFFGEAPMPQLKAHEVLIKVHTTAINRADTLQRKGKYAPPEGTSPVLGLEAAGHVHQLSEEATKWKTGDRVMALLSGGGNAEYAAVHEDHLLPIPDGMSYTEAAAIPEVWLAAYQILHLVGGVKAGDFVLIHAGGSGVGTAAVQLTRLAGARPIVTAGSQAKLDKAISLGAEHGFNYKEGPWEEKVKKATDGHGADVILDCVGASYLEQNVGALANDGRWVLYGLLGGPRVEGNLLGKLLMKRGTLAATLLRPRSIKYKADLVAAFNKEALPHFATGNLKPIIAQTFPADEISAAHMTMESNANSGKLVLIVMNEEVPKDKSEL